MMSRKSHPVSTSPQYWLTAFPNAAYQIHVWWMPSGWQCYGEYWYHLSVPTLLNCPSLSECCEVLFFILCFMIFFVALGTTVWQRMVAHNIFWLSQADYQLVHPWCSTMRNILQTYIWTVWMIYTAWVVLLVCGGLTSDGCKSNTENILFLKCWIETIVVLQKTDQSKCFWVSSFKIWEATATPYWTE